MTTDNFIELLESVRNGVDPRNGITFSKRDSFLKDAAISRALNRLIRTLIVEPEVIEVDIPDAVITEACQELRALGYQPSVMQLAKVFIGSRSIVDRNLKALTSYNRYRGIYKRQLIHAHLMAFYRRKPTILQEFPDREVKTVHEPWKEVDFFRTEVFDKLEDAKETELRQAVAALGLRKDESKLPAYMAEARTRYPRSFEPWVREEQSLLIEAMCYTNQAERLAAIFGRSANSIERTGQRLIWESQEQHRQRVA
ncbi:MAG: hypothetical protein AAF597_11915 [Bacteroidota bacterium]